MELEAVPAYQQASYSEKNKDWLVQNFWEDGKTPLCLGERNESRL